MKHPHVHQSLHRRALATAKWFLVGVVACSPGAGTPLDTSGAILPDTITIDSVLHMRHGADAFARAPQFTIDSVPLAMIDGGADTLFRLGLVDRPLVLPDGRVVVSNDRVVVFDAAGKPSRVVAESGLGPDQVQRPSAPLHLGGDTILIIDLHHRRASWFSADSGLVHSEMLSEKVRSWCIHPSGMLPGGRLLTFDMCDRLGAIDSVVRTPLPVITLDARYELADTLLTLPGEEVAPFYPAHGHMRFSRTEELRFGRRGFMAPWRHMIAAAHGSEGYTIERWSTLGRLQGKVVVAVPRRAVTSAMLQHEIARGLAWLDALPPDPVFDREASRERIRNLPTADSLPPYAGLHPGASGLLWVSDYALHGDTLVTATAFRADGAIVARLTIPGRRIPVWFGPDRVMLREVDANRVVRFGIYRIVSTRGGS